MSAARRRALQLAATWHRRLLWPAALALLCFVVSGISHPLMVWTGPQVQQFHPPTASLHGDQLRGLAVVAARHPDASAALLKWVPSAAGPVVQLSTDRQAPARYFDSASGAELPGHDRPQAIWLARHYSGEQSAAIRSARFQSAFDLDYPAVNRLLPVWQVCFERADGLCLYIHTETLSAAAVSNHWKNALQTAFQWLHTQRALAPWPGLQFAAMNGLLLALAGFTLAGVLLALAAPGRRRIPQGSRRWHRRLALALYLPLLLLVASGGYHLWYSALRGGLSGQSLGGPVPLARLAPALAGLELPAGLAGRELLSMSAVGDGEHWYLRLGIPPSDTAAPARQQRFQGRPTEADASYLPLTAGAPPLDDRGFARQLARSRLTAGERIERVERVFRFGEGYDFRNKRLPVWRVITDRQWLYVDPASGALVESLDGAARLEGMSFGTLHKWNPLTPVLGRAGRDLLVIAVLAALATLAALGLRLRWRGRAAPHRAGRGQRPAGDPVR